MKDAAQFRYRRHRRHAFALLVMLSIGGARFAAQAPQPPAAPAAPANQRPAVQSPVIEAGRITFNVYAPKASAVILSLIHI